MNDDVEVFLQNKEDIESIVDRIRVKCDLLLASTKVEKINKLANDLDGLGNSLVSASRDLKGLALYYMGEGS